MTYLLDTNAWVVLLRNQNAGLATRFSQCPAASISLCSIVLFELWYGVHRSDPQYRAGNQKLVEEIESTYPSWSFDDRAAHHAATVRAALASAGQPIGPYDLAIAAIALANNCILVTRNVNEFQRVPGLSIENWQQG